MCISRIYAAALDLFRLRLVHDAVHRKLVIMRETYTALYEEAFASPARTLRRYQISWLQRPSALASEQPPRQQESAAETIRCWRRTRAHTKGQTRPLAASPAGA